MDTPSHESSKSFVEPEQQQSVQVFSKRDESAATLEETYPPVWRQWLILLTLNLAMLIDVVSGSALFVVISDTARDLGLAGGDISWM